MENLIHRRKSSKNKMKKITGVLFILSLLVFVIGTFAFLKNNYTILVISQLLIMFMLLGVSIFEYKFRKLENSLYDNLKSSKLNEKSLDRVNKLQGYKSFIDKISVLFMSLSLGLFITALLLKIFKDIAIFSLVKNISLICFCILFWLESRYSRLLTITIDYLISKNSQLNNIVI